MEFIDLIIERGSGPGEPRPQGKPAAEGLVCCLRLDAWGFIIDN
jgi:hypothetical protein